MAKRTRLKLFRVEQGLSQEAMATELGYKRSQYAAVENGKYNPTLRFIEAFKERFNRSHDEAINILKKDGEEKKPHRSPYRMR
jgi:transcriptional regulator with XRE-family HTH domain